MKPLRFIWFSALVVGQLQPGHAQTEAPLQILSTASLAPGPLAPGSLIAAVGGNLAVSIAAADLDQPLPFFLAGTSLAITDSAGNVQAASLLFVSPTQINFVMPDGLPSGAAAVTVTNANGDTISSAVMVTPTAPGLFSADGSGTGPGAGQVLHLHSDGTSVEQPVAAYDTDQATFLPVAVDVSSDAGQALLFLFGTGIRNAPAVAVTANGKKLAVLYAGPEGGVPGLDQVNVELPAALAGAQSVDLVVTAGGQSSNAVRVAIQ